MLTGFSPLFYCGFKTSFFVCVHKIGEKFGFGGNETMVTNEDGAEIDSIEVIRDNDKLYFVEIK